MNTTFLAAAAHTASLLACWDRMRTWFPIFAAVDVLHDTCEWLSELRNEYAALRMRRGAIARTYGDYAKDLVHYCDGATIVLPHARVFGPKTWYRPRPSYVRPPSGSHLWHCK
jgi:hypothetical protein